MLAVWVVWAAWAGLSRLYSLGKFYIQSGNFFQGGVAYLKFFSQASKSLKNDPRVELAGSSVAVDLSLLSGKYHQLGDPKKLGRSYSLKATEALGKKD